MTVARPSASPLVTTGAVRLVRTLSSSLRRLLLLSLTIATIAGSSVAQEAGFSSQLVSSEFEAAVGITFASDGLGFVWEKPGRVWTLEEDGHKHDHPLIDISDEVANYGDYGLIGFALDPGFTVNGYYYLLYAVDHHHAFEFGQKGYDPTTNEYFRATIGRLTRYQADASDGFHSTVPGSRTVLIGESPSTGFPLMSQTHGPGSLVFGADGTLLISCGDASSPQVVDGGGAAQGSYAPQGLAEGILRPDENVGAFRAQQIDSLCGKILRVDPATGDGVPSNPFYDAVSPRAARSRVWALGLRQPYRMCRKPGTGSADPALGDPGVLFIGDVGWATWEELNVCDAPGENFGWPIFEGMMPHPGYSTTIVANPQAPNPLAGSGCSSFFSFQDLIQQETLAAPSFPNPCDLGQTITTAPTFIHHRPRLDWNHASTDARTATFDGTSATVTSLGTPGSPVAGLAFSGSCSTGGAWYVGDVFPPEYRVYFHGDFVEGWVRAIRFDLANRPVEVTPIAETLGIVAMAMHPTDGALYVISYTSQVRRIQYTPCGNRPPVAVLPQPQYYGPGPLTVGFDGSGSTDEDQDVLTYAWDFGDGSAPSNEVAPTHTYSPPTSSPTRYDGTLTVTDAFGATSTASFIVSVNNTPPVVTILSPIDGETYPLDGDTVHALTADVFDAEHGPAELDCAWQTILHHETHSHPEPWDHACETTTVTSPLGCGAEVYFYRVVLEVTDAAGLSTSAEVTLLPDCEAGGGGGVIHATADPETLTVVQGHGAAFVVIVENAGAVELTAPSLDIDVDDVALIGGDVDGDGVLQPTESWVYACQIDSVDASTIVPFTATGVGSVGQVVSDSSQVTIEALSTSIRISDGLVAYYPFDESGGATVHDRSGVEPPLDLTIASPGAVSWISGGGVSVQQATQIGSTGLAG
ncbi:MAG: PQQ-dependent sugar dehydrogenase, partial [Planctomycetes bacterium]|nr:PQQ-dependent sugar dehydrogenase [Planctomycetota bacterium]